MFKLNGKGVGKREIAMILCTGLVLGSLSGCGGEYAGVGRGDGVSGSAVSGNAVSGSAISGSAVSDSASEDGKADGKTDGKTDGKAVSGSAVQVKRKPESYPYCTDTNLYYEKGDIIWQVRLDGTHKKCIVEGEMNERDLWLHYADADWLYYEIWYEDDDKDILYRAPIRKDKDGYDEVCIADAEELFAEDFILPAYQADSHYFFYECDEEYAKYDLREQKKIVLAKESGDDYGMYEDTYVYKIGDRYAVFVVGEGIYALDEDGTQWEQVSDELKFCQYDEDKITVVQGEQAVYYEQRRIYEDEDFYNIRKYDGEKITDFVTKEQQKDAVIKALHADKLDVFDTNGLFCEGGRLYIQLAVGWEEKGTYHMEYVILSKEEENDSGLHYEKELTECMKSHGKNRNGRWVAVYGEPAVFIDSMIVNDAQCIAVADGKAYMSIRDYGKHKGRLGCYDLTDKKFQWVKREDALFYRLGYEMNLDEFAILFTAGKNAEEDIDDEDLYIGFKYLYPQADKHWTGEFVENP